jgi:hypothetical protein
MTAIRAAGDKPNLRKQVTGPSPGDLLIQRSRTTLELIANNKAVSLLIYIGFVFLKTLAVSAWRLPTALGVLHVSSLPAVFAGATLSALPTVVVVILSVIIFMLFAGHWRDDWSKPTRPPTSRYLNFRRTIWCNRSFVWIVAGLLIAVLILSPWKLAAIALGAALLLGIAAHPLRSRAERKGIRALLTAVFTALLVVLLVLSYNQFVAAVWIPHEDLLLTNGSHEVGYVLSDDNGEVTLLQSHTRLLKIVSDVEITQRSVCTLQPRSWYKSIPTSNSVILNIFGRPGIPVCTRR